MTSPDKKRPRDLNLLAASVVEEATSEAPPFEESPAAEHGRSGGLIGGKARAEKLTPEQRSAIARRAAAARWNRRSKQ